MTRPFDKHLDSDELDGLLSLQRTGVSDSEQLSEQSLREAQRHVESCQDCSRNLQMHRYVQSEILRMRAPTPSPPTPECIGDAEWLEVAAGLLPDAKTRELMKHAAQCGHCGPLLKNAAEALVDEITPDEEAWLASLRSARPEWRKNMAETLRSSAGTKDSSREKKEDAPRWQALFSWPRPAFALAGIAVAVMAGWLAVRMLRPPSAEQLLAQAYTERRTLEVRIPSAKFAPMRVERGAGGSNLDKPTSLLKAEALIGDSLRKHPNDPLWLQARGRADLLDGNYESAIKSLQQALEIQPDSPQLLTDLASAYFERAEAADRAIDYGNAIEALGKALGKAPDDPVALFNRALICERIFLYTQAVDDWEHYLRIDPQGEWAEEARKRLAAIQEKLKQHARSQAEPLLEPSKIAKADSDDAKRAKIDERIEEYLQLAVSDWLPKAYPIGKMDSPDTNELRTALQVVADLAVQKHSDRWLADVLSGAAAADFPSAVSELSRALKASDLGDNVAARHHASAAERLFASAGIDAGVLRARVEYLFSSHVAQEGDKCMEATQSLEKHLEIRAYPWLSTQFHLEQGTCFWLLGNLGEARMSYGRAESEAETAGYRVIYLRSQDHLSGLSAEAGDFAASWAKTQSALARFWADHYPAMRGYNLYYNYYEASRLTRKPHLQMAAWRDALALSDSFSDNALRAMAHSAMADAAVAAGMPHVAEEEFSKAGQFFLASTQIKSTRIARIEAETRLAEVEASQGRAQQAVFRLQRFVPEVAQLSDVFLGILFHSTLGDAESRIGGAQEAESELHSAVALAELQLQSLHSDKSRIDWEARTSSAYRGLAQLRLRQGNAQGALEIWELYRGAAPRSGTGSNSAFLSAAQSLVEPHEVTAQLPRLMKETVVSYAMLPRGLAVWVYDNRGVFAHWIEENPGNIEARAEQFRSLCSDPNSDLSLLRRDARDLYDVLVAPIEQQLSPGRLLMIELDDRLVGLPFDALVDAQGHYLSERGAVVSSVGIYYRRDARAIAPITVDSAALVVAVPTAFAVGDLSAVPLPDAASEGKMVVHGFHTAQLLSAQDATAAAVLSRLPDAEVFHFAGHAFSSQQRSGLLLSDSLLSAASLQEISLSRLRLAVFSACDTQGGSNGGAYDSDSLVRVFLRAGVPNVLASRWNVDSAATRQFMDLFYRALLNGSAAADAIRQAQSGLRSRPGMAHPYYWSAFATFRLA